MVAARDVSEPGPVGGAGGVLVALGKAALAVVAILGIAWLGTCFFEGNRTAIIASISDTVTRAPWIFALGLFTTAVIFDVLTLATGSPHWPVAGYYMIGAGIIGGLLAAVFGAIDWLVDAKPGLYDALDVPLRPATGRLGRCPRIAQERR